MGMVALGRWLEAERERRGLSKAAVAKAVAISPSYVTRLENGDPAYKSVGHDVLRRFAALYDATDEHLEALLYDRPLPRTVLTGPELAREVPIVADLSAGHRGGAIDGYEYVPVSDTRGRLLRAARVTGECMAPAILPGDVVLFDANRQPRDGQVVAAVIPDPAHERGRGVVKRFYRLGDKVQLSPLVGEPLLLPVGEVRIEGVVVEVRRKLAG